MKTAKDYKITFGYGAIDGVYYGASAKGKPTYIGPYHRGEDRAMPQGTPVVVNGVQIGLAGATGAASGPHLHVGRFVDGDDTDPDGGGFSFKNAEVTEINEDDVNGKYVRVQADGASWVYLHLSKQTARVGQKLIAPKPIPVAQYYTVVSGDNLSMIARKKKTTLAALKKLNPVNKLHSHNYDLIYPGEKIRFK